MDNSTASDRVRSSRDQLVRYLEELGGYSEQQLIQLIGTCGTNHQHRASCDRHFYLIKHLIHWLKFGPVWVRIDSPTGLRFALPGPKYEMSWWQMDWPEGIRVYCEG